MEYHQTSCTVLPTWFEVGDWLSLIPRLRDSDLVSFPGHFSHHTLALYLNHAGEEVVFLLLCVQAWPHTRNNSEIRLYILPFNCSVKLMKKKIAGKRTVLYPPLSRKAPRILLQSQWGHSCICGRGRPGLSGAAPRQSALPASHSSGG